MRHPVHVTMRVTQRLKDIRGRKVYGALRNVLWQYIGLDDFRVCHVSLQQTHLHMIVEASSREALMHHMRGFTINLARAINRALKRTGQVFGQRYHTRQVKTSTQAYRNVRYVLSNWRKHQVDVITLFRTDYPVDPYSSGPSFQRWSIETPAMPDWYHPLPVSPPKTALLASVCRIDPFAIPSSLR